MNMRTAIALASVLILSAGLYGCGSGGGDADARTDVRTTTVGQELQDLQRAYDSGALTKEEYENQREKILDRD